MDYEMLKNTDQMIRDSFLREELGVEKCRILDKYQLRSNSRLYWERSHIHYPVQEYFSHKFAKKAPPLGIIFHIYKLCYAKVKYFDQNWDDYTPCIYDWQSGLFVETQVSDMEFIRQSGTGIIIDLRNLAKINQYEDFLELCKFLEEQKRMVSIVSV